MIPPIEHGTVKSSIAQESHSTLPQWAAVVAAWSIPAQSHVIPYNRSVFINFHSVSSGNALFQCAGGSAKHGSPLRPVSFAVVMDRLADEVRQESPKTTRVADVTEIAGERE